MNQLTQASKAKVRVAFLNTHPIQYFAPLYAYLNQADDLSITALYLSDYSVRGAQDHAFRRIVKWDIDLLTGYNAHFVSGATRRNEPRGFFSIVAPELWSELRAGHFDALVVHGHTPAAYLLGIAAAKLAGVRVFMRAETHLGLFRSPLRYAVRKLIIGRLYAWCDGVLAIGTANAAFYRAVGVPNSRVFLMPYAVDNARFMDGSNFTSVERAQMRLSVGVHDDRPIVLYAAKFDRQKRPRDVLHAAARLQREGLVFQLLMVGSGEMETELRGLAVQLGLQGIHFHGFVNQSALPGTYAACDIFVLPSENEPWGLAVNEAMCAGLPIVASQEIGCVPDLVRNGFNGITFTSGDIAGLRQALRELLLDAGKRHRYGAASRDIISRWSYAECLEGLRAALGMGRPRLGCGLSGDINAVTGSISK